MRVESIRKPHLMQSDIRVDDEVMTFALVIETSSIGA